MIRTHYPAKKLLLSLLIIISITSCGLNSTDELEEYWISPNGLPWLTEADSRNIEILQTRAGLDPNNPQYFTDAHLDITKKYIERNNKNSRFHTNRYIPKKSNKGFPQPGSTIPQNLIIELKFNTPMTSVSVNNIPAWGHGQYWEARPSPPAGHTTGQPIYLAIKTTTKQGQTGTSYAWPYYLTDADLNAPEITHSTIPDGATNISHNTNEITVTFNEPIGPFAGASITDYASNKQLNWEHYPGENSYTLRELTPADVKRITDENSVPGYRVAGSGENTKIVHTKEPTIHGLTPSETLQPNRRYEIRITITDRSNNQSKFTITFRTRK